MEENELWTKKLKEKLQDYSEPLPVAGWECLEKELGTPAVRRVFFLRRQLLPVAAAAALLVLLSSVAYYLWQLPAGQVPPLPIVRTAAPSTQTPDRLAKAEPQPSDRPDTPVRQLSRSLRNATVPEGEEATAPVANSDATPEEVAVARNEEGAEPQPHEELPVRKVRPTHAPSVREKYHFPVTPKEKERGKWAIGLSVGHAGSTLASAEGSGKDQMRVSMSEVANDVMSIPGDKCLVFDENVPYLEAEHRVLEMSHSQLITFGISLRRNLTSSLSLESGLTYTRLSSDALLVDGYRRVEQQLHYVGIPLRAGWTWLDKKPMQFYLSGGGAIEKCVSGKLGSEKLSVSPLQLSLSAAVGMQWALTRHLGLYVEPGLSYFFDDGSTIQSIRKERPLQFNLQAGIRFSY